MPSPDRNLKRLEILERRRKVAARYLRGQTQWEIARAFETTQATISKDLKAIHEEWEAQAAFCRGEWIARQIATIDEVERVAWQCLAKSQENTEVLRARMRGDKSESEKVITTQAGDPRFLQLILQCVKQRSELLRLLDPQPDAEDGDLEGEDAELDALAAQLRAAVARCRAGNSGDDVVTSS